MPDVAVGWVRSLLGSLGGIWGGNLYILGVALAGYDTPIWDVLALQGKREEAGERLYGARFVELFPIRQAVPDGLAWARFCSWARWARFFIGKSMYCSRYNIFTYNALFYKCLSTREWVDGIGCVWMTLSRLGRCSHLGYNSFTRLRCMAGVPHMHHKLINKYIYCPQGGVVPPCCVIMFN